MAIGKGDSLFLPLCFMELDICSMYFERGMGSFAIWVRTCQQGSVIFLSQIESRIRLGMKKTWLSAIGMIFSDQA